MRYFSMFSGIGGFELGIQRAYGDAECVGYSEIDKYATKVYGGRFNGHTNFGDATTIDTKQLPDFDLVVGGFPCQAFSIAGKRRGFDEARGTLFFDIARILKDKKPRHLVLENVKGLLSHDSGRTFQTIIGVLADLGYRVEWQLLNSKDYGVPQNRERVIIVGHLRGECASKIFPIGSSNTQLADETNEQGVTNTLTGRSAGGQNRRGNYIRSGTLRTHKDGRGFREVKSGLAPTLPARAREDGSGQAVIAIPVLTPERPEKRQNGRRFKEDGDPAFTVNTQDKHGVYDGESIRRLTPVECERLQGFPDDWTLGESDTQRYKMCGNAVTVNVIEAVMSKLLTHEEMAV